MKSFVSFESKQFDRIFPYHILLDSRASILSCGTKIMDTIPGITGKPFNEFFTIQNPGISGPDKITAESQTGIPVLIGCKSSERFFIYGQFEFLPEKNQLLFIGFPFPGQAEPLTIGDPAFNNACTQMIWRDEVMNDQVVEYRNLIEKHRNSENRMTTLIHNLIEGVLLEDENRKIVITNQNFCSLFNIPASPDELRGTDCSQSAEQSKHFFKDPEEFVIRIGQILREKKAVLSEELELANGQFYERDYIPISIDDTSKGHLWKYTNITERKNQEQLQKQKEEKYRNIIANMKMGLMETDNDDTIEYVNQRFCEMTGYSSEEILGKKSIDLLVPDKDKQMLLERSWSRKDGNSDYYELEVSVKNGEIRWWLNSGGPKFNEKGMQTGMIGISVDVTDQKLLQRELEIAREKAEESSIAKESFLANMSHEIRTPLNAIIGLIREISHEPTTPSQQHYLHNAGLASQHLLSIVNDILDITKIESGQLKLEYKAFNLHQVIDNAVSILSPAVEGKKLKVTTKISRSLAPAYIGDSNRIKQILLNLLNNSIKFTDKGKITVECKIIRVPDKKSLHRIQLTVSDTGIGMEESFLENLFDKFSQGEASTARKFGGTGLGLAITRELVQMMQGEIHVTSKKGVGTSFGILLDLEPGTEADREKVVPPEQNYSLKNKEILLVEDNDLNRLVAKNSLSRHGVLVTEATNGSEALDQLKKKTFDLILMDLQMPVMDGIKTTNIIRKEMHLNIPIIALTADAFKTELDLSLKAGMNDYITKPFEESVLLRTILRNLTVKNISTETKESLSDATVEVSKKSFNLDYIRKFSQENPDFIRKMIRLFHELMPASVNEIQTALKKGDAEQVRKVAHRIKPTIDNFGIDDLKQDIRLIEAMAKEGLVSPDVGVLVDRLANVIQRVDKELENEQL